MFSSQHNTRSSDDSITRSVVAWWSCGFNRVHRAELKVQKVQNTRAGKFLGRRRRRCSPLCVCDKSFHEARWRTRVVVVDVDVDVATDHCY